MFSTISTTITNAATPGSAGYGIGIVITDTGAIITADTPALAAGAAQTGANAVILNDGQILTTGDTYAVELGKLATLNNAGTISGGSGLYSQYGHGTANTVTNEGTIIGTEAYGLKSNGLNLANSGDISGAATGIYMRLFGNLVNTGTIYGGITGAELSSGVAVNNSGSIGGAVDGIVLGSNAAGEVLTNSGTISGGTDAIYDRERQLELVAEPGAVFNGAVVDTGGSSYLILGGSGTGSLNIGGSFAGFNSINFLSAGAQWTLAGSLTALANGQVITGFRPGNDIILDGFAATSASYVSGVGLVLSGATDAEILNLNGLYSKETYSLTSDGTNSTITAIGQIGTLISTISGDAGMVTPGSGYYADTVTIAATGTVTGVSNGNFVHGVTVVNDGLILNGAGLLSSNYDFPNTFINNGNISSSSAYGFPGLVLQNGIIVNTGHITSEYGNGVLLQGGTLTNSGVISGYGHGVYVYRGGVVVNSGTISGEIGQNGEVGEALAGLGTGFNLVLDPGAEFVGGVEGGDLQAGLTLAGTGAGTLDMNNTFSGFSIIHFDAGPDWTLEGNASELAGHETITGFTLGDTIVLDGFAATGKVYAGGSELVLLDGPHTETLDIISTFATGDFSVTDNASGDTVIDILCYMRGTHIITPAGERRVEELRPGDPVITRFSGIHPIKWIGRQSFAGRFLIRNPEKQPVLISAGALGEGLPARDLYVSPGHSVLLGGTLVLAQNLLNGITITQDDVPERVDYYAIELEAHDCVVAEGIWAETYADGPGLRAQFHNVAEFYAIFPNHVAPEALHLCAPRPERGPDLAAALAPIVARAAALTVPGALRGFIDIVSETRVEGWAQDMANPELPVALEVCQGDNVLGNVLACDYRPDLARAAIGHGRAMFSFALPDGLDAAARAAITVRRSGGGPALPHSNNGLGQLVAA